MALNPDEHRLSDAEHQVIFERDIKPELFADAKPSERPIAVIFGGQPGAGKSAAIDGVMVELGRQGGVVQIIGDDLRDYHPKYAHLMAADDKTAAFYTDRDAGRWVEKAIAEAKAQRVNVVIEGTMRSPEVVAETMQGLRQAGYQIDARALAVTSRLSEQGIMQRYENQKADRGVGRMTTPEAHRAAYDGMLQTLDRIEGQKLADRVTIYRRGAEVIYSNELQAGQWVREPQARSVVEFERARPMTLEERRDYAKGFDELSEMLARRQATADEIRKVADLQRESKAAVMAEVFRQASPGDAVKMHPELAGAAAAVSAMEKKAEADGLDAQQRAIVMARVRDNVVNSIERGQIPEVKLKEEIEVKREVSAEKEHSR